MQFISVAVVWALSSESSFIRVCHAFFALRKTVSIYRFVFTSKLIFHVTDCYQFVFIHAWFI